MLKVMSRVQFISNETCEHQKNPKHFKVKLIIKETESEKVIGQVSDFIFTPMVWNYTYERPCHGSHTIPDHP